MSFFFNDTATTEIYTLSLHDALPISDRVLGRRDAQDRPERRDAGVRRAEPVAHRVQGRRGNPQVPGRGARGAQAGTDRKSTRLNSSHSQISYAVFCLKKKKKKKKINK